MGHFAELAPDQTVIRVIVAEPGWAEEHLGGTWVETSDPYTTQQQAVTYCGPGYGYDPAFQENFAPPWEPWDGTFDENNKTLYQEGSLVSHHGHIWRSTAPNNVWEPGVSGWKDSDC